MNYGAKMTDTEVKQKQSRIFAFAMVYAPKTLVGRTSISQLIGNFR
jgi:hypothetical protein